MNTRAVASVVSIVAIGVGAALYLFRTEDTRAPGVDALPPAPEARGAPTAGVSIPRSDGSPAPTTSAGQGASSAPTERADSPPSADSADAAAPLPHQAPRTPMAQSLDDLQLPPIPELLETERAFAAEPVDPAWATATEGQILGKFAEAAGIKLVTLRVECKTSLCRVQVAEPELSGANPPAPAATAAGGGRTVRVATFLELVSGLGLDPRWAMTVTDRQGTLTSFAYLARGGSAKPEDGAGAIR